MTVEELLKQAGAELQEYGYTHGMREADIFLSHILKLDSGTLFSKYEDPVDETAIEAIQEMIEARIKGAPLAYIIGEQPFMGWTLLSDDRALIPRPETEQLVEEMVREIRGFKKESGQILEIGTGAGPISLALKKYFPGSEITATDVSDEALSLAAENAKRLKVHIEFVESDLFKDLPEKKYDVVVANLPYVPTDKLAFTSEQILDWEPMIAIEAGADGLLYIKPFMEELGKYLAPDGIGAIEFWHTHGEPVKELAKKYLPNHEVEIRKDLAGFDRYAFFLPR